MVIKNVFIGIMAFFFLTAGVCVMVPPSEFMQQSELPGTFVTNFNAGLADTLHLYANGTYKRIFIDKNNQIFVDSGEWDFEVSRVKERLYGVYFKNFAYRFPVDPIYTWQYSTRANAVMDSIPKHVTMSADKYFWGDNVVYCLGDRYDQCWERSEPKDTVNKP